MRTGATPPLFDRIFSVTGYGLKVSLPSCQRIELETLGSRFFPDFS